MTKSDFLVSQNQLSSKLRIVLPDNSFVVLADTIASLADTMPHHKDNTALASRTAMCPGDRHLGHIKTHVSSADATHISTSILTSTLLVSFRDRINTPNHAGRHNRTQNSKNLARIE